MAKRKKKKRKIKRKKIKKKTKKKNRKRIKKRRKKSSKKKRVFEKTSSKETKDSDGNLVFKVSKNWSKQAYVNKSQYEKKYRLSIKENENFWRKEGKRITWIKPYKKIKDVKYSKKEVNIKWYYDGTLNASANCITSFPFSFSSARLSCIQDFKSLFSVRNSS